MDKNGLSDNLQTIVDQTDQLIVNFDESFKIPIYISKDKDTIATIELEEK